MAKIEQLRKITIGSCGAQPSLEQLAKLEKSGGFLPLLDVYGIARKFKPDDSDKGPYVRFYGQFKAIRATDRAAFQAGQLIMPKIIEEGLFGVMRAEEVNDVQFAFRVGVKFDAKTASKYVYAAESLTPVAENDPLAMLEKQLTGKLLTAPKS